MKKNLQTAVLSHDAYWAIEPQAAQAILAQLRITDPQAHQEEVEARTPAAARFSEGSGESKPYQMYGTTAIIQVSGPMTKKGSSFGTGGTIETRNLIRRATADGDVKSIVLVWDSPGGSVAGTEDLATDIINAARKKEVCSFIEDTCCSAALWCACQAGSVYANATAIIGSIGVFSYAIDMSRMAENAGIAVHLLSTGKFKGAGAVDGVPISEEQLAEMQATVDVLGTHFINAMARGRNMSADAIAEIADGRVWIGQDAMAVGLIDGIATLDDVLAGLQKVNSRRSMSAEGPQQFASASAELQFLHDCLPDSAEAAKGQLAIAAKIAAKWETPLNNFASEQGLPIGLSLEHHLESVLIAVEGSREQVQALCERIAKIKGLRANQQRSFSQARLEQLKALDAEVTEVALGMEALVNECQALGSTTATEDQTTEASAPDLSAQDATRERLNAAIAGVTDLLATA